jgi:hypothetical protein
MVLTMKRLGTQGLFQGDGNTSNLARPTAPFILPDLKIALDAFELPLLLGLIAFSYFQ